MWTLCVSVCERKEEPCRCCFVCVRGGVELEEKRNERCRMCDL